MAIKMSQQLNLAKGALGQNRLFKNLLNLFNGHVLPSFNVLGSTVRVGG